MAYASGSNWDIYALVYGFYNLWFNLPILPFEDYSKETLKIRKEKWKEVKELRKNGTYAILVYDKVAIKGKYRKQ